MPPTLVSLEFLVTDLERALELLVEHVGLALVGRERHQVFDAEVAVLEAPPLAIILLSPTETEQGRPVPLPNDRMSQLVFELDDTQELAALRERLVSSGASVAHDGAEMFHLSTSFIEALFGEAPALVFTTAADPTMSGAPQDEGPASAASPAEPESLV